MSALFLPALCAAVLTAGLFARIDVYGAFVRGAKAGMETLLQMAPCLCAVLTLSALDRNRRIEYNNPKWFYMLLTSLCGLARL